MNEYDFRPICEYCNGDGATISTYPSPNSEYLKGGYFCNECYNCKGVGRTEITETLELEKSK